MCTTYQYRGHLIHTMDDARRYLGTAHIVVDGGHQLSALEGRMCCCPIDAEQTAELLRCYLKDDGSGDFVEFVPLETSHQTNEIKEQNAP